MSKVNVRSILLNKDTNERTIVETIGILNKNKLIFNDNNTVVKILFNENELIMTREEKNKSLIEFIFKENIKTHCNYNIYSKNLKLSLYTNKIMKNKNDFEIDYTIEENENLNFKLIVKEIE